MADLSKTVSIVFDGDNSKIKSVIGEVDNRFDSMENKIGKNVTALAGVIAGFVASVGGIATAFAAAAVDAETAIINIKNQLALTPEETERISDILRDVYKTGLSEGMDDAKNAVILAYRQMREGTDAEITAMATKALSLKTTFGIEVNESLGGVKRLMEDFGASADTAFGFIVKGAQEGINGSDDLIDTITEYGGLFDEAGFSAEEFYRLLKEGYQPGTTLGTDKVADLIKEFKVKLEEGATATSDAYSQIGIDFESLITGIDDGTITIADAFDAVVEELGKIPSKTEQFQLGTAIFGTPFEDLGTTLVTSLTEVVGGVPVALEDSINSLDTGGTANALKKYMRAWSDSALNEKADTFGTTAWWKEKFTGWIENLNNIIDEADADAEPIVFKGKIEVPEEMLEQNITVDAIEGESVAALEARISEAFPDEIDETLNATVDVDNENAKQKVQDVVDKADELETTKLMEIQLQGEIDTQIETIKATAETAQASFEYKAKVDVAQAQADADIIESMFTSVDTSINSTGETLTALFGMLTEDLTISESWLLKDAIEAEIEYREKAFEKQSELIDAQVALIEARTAALESGDGLIKIDSAGLEPALELVMWEILEKVQVRASENVQEFLLGM